MGDAIDRIAEAIDQLARDAHGDFSEPELAARVADLWLMLSALDPELARRKQGYGTSFPEGQAGSGGPRVPPSGESPGASEPGAPGAYGPGGLWGDG